MFHLRLKTHSTATIHGPSHGRRHLFARDIALVIAILVLLALIALRSSSLPWVSLVNSLFQNRSANSPESAESQRVQDLMTELKNPNADVRLNATRELGSMRAAEATDALLVATYDPVARVREQAAVAVGEIGAVRAIPRLRELQIAQGNSFIKTAALEAEDKIARNIAAQLNVTRPELQALAVAQNGSAYAVSSNNLYVSNDGRWLYITRLPDSFNDLAIGPDGQLLFVATQGAGLYKSGDGGQTWEYLEFGLQTPTQLTVTAVVVNPKNAQRVFVALAAPGSDGNQQNSLGVAVSQDGGKTWSALPNSPSWSVTRHLVIDRTTPNFLYGLADEGPWRYTLPPNMIDPD